MFVKILRTIEDVEQVDVYECENVSAWTAKEDSSIIRLRLDMQMLIDVEKEGSQIFYLNNEGRTIDRVRG